MGVEQHGLIMTGDRFVERACFTTGSALLLFLFVPSVIKLVFHFHTSMGWEIEPFLFTVDVLSRGAFYEMSLKFPLSL